MEVRTAELLSRREEHKKAIHLLERLSEQLTQEIVEIEGRCPVCKSGHYPHCRNTGNGSY